MLRRLVLSPLVCLLSACPPGGFLTELKGDATVPGGPVSQLSGFPALAAFTDLDFDNTPEFKSHGVSKAQVSAARAESVKFRILSPMDQDFRFLDSLQLVAVSGDQETLVAEQLAIYGLDLAAPNPTLYLGVKTTNISEHLTAPSTSLVVRAKGRTPPKDTRLEVTVGLRVELNGY